MTQVTLQLDHRRRHALRAMNVLLLVFFGSLHALQAIIRLQMQVLQTETLA